jgi:ABC-2 type transport system ATP-binding protein
VGVDGGAEQLTAGLASLNGLSGAIDDIALRQPTLNEVFLALTGQALAEESETSSKASKKE